MVHPSESLLGIDAEPFPWVFRYFERLEQDDMLALLALLRHDDQNVIVHASGLIGRLSLCTGLLGAMFGVHTSPGTADAVHRGATTFRMMVPPGAEDVMIKKAVTMGWTQTTVSGQPTKPDPNAGSKVLTAGDSGVGTQLNCTESGVVDNCSNKVFGDVGCWNPLCTRDISIQGITFSKCAACKLAQYCSRECQKADWKRHRPICKKTQCQAMQR